MALNTAQFHPLRKLQPFTLLLVALLCGLIWGLWPQAVRAQDPATEVLNAINAARAENGLAPLAVNPYLNQAAQGHVNDMINNYVYGHYGSDGSTVQMRVARTGYSETPWVSENWVSSSNATGAMRWWMGDYIHRVNILTGRWTEIGIGVASRGSEMIFVTVFSAGGGATDAGGVVAAPVPQQAAPPPSVRIEQVSVPAEGMDYAVQAGDTLLAIGLRYGLPWERIAGANGLNERSLLQIGQTLRIPGDESTVVPPKVEVKTEDYTIQPNDTLFSIAANRGMFWEEVAAVNGFGEHTILQIGQVIQVPVVEEEMVFQNTLLVNTRRDAFGPVLQDESPTNFASYTLKQFDPAGVGGPTGDVTRIAMAKSDVAGASTAVLAAYAAAAPAVDSTTAAPMAAEVAVASAVVAPAEVATVEVATTENVAVAESAVGSATENVASAEVADAAVATANVASVEVASAEVATANVASAEVASADVSTAEVGTASAATQPTLYAVQAGDTIISIAIQHELEWGALLALNGLGEDSVLQPGQLIRLR